MHLASLRVAGGCFTIVSRALQNILSKFVYCRNRTSYENFQLKLCVCAQSLALEALGTHTKFQLEILTINMISGIVYSRNVSETTPWFPPTLPPLPSPHKGTGKQSSETTEYKLLHGPRVTTEVAQQRCKRCKLRLFHAAPDTTSIGTLCKARSLLFGMWNRLVQAAAAKQHSYSGIARGTCPHTCRIYSAENSQQTT